MSIVDEGLSMLPPINAGGTAGVITLFVYFGILVSVIGVITYFIINWLRYNKKVVVFENISGNGFQPIGKDKAMTVKMGDSGEEILYLKKRKTYKTAYGKRMGKNVYWFAVGQDGYWYNFLLGDLDAKKGELDIEPVDRDMRYMHVAIRRNMAQRFDKKNWFKENIGMLVGIGAIIIILVFMWLLADKYFAMGEIATTSMRLSIEATQKVNEVLGRLDAVCSGGSGVISAG